MSGQMKSMPATSRPTMRAASSAISTLSGCASKVRSMEMPLADRVGAVADDVRRHALGDRPHAAAHDEAAVVPAGHERLDDDRAAPRLCLVDLRVALQVEAHTATVVAVERLDDDGEPDAPGRLDRAAHRARGLLLGHRQAGRAEQLRRQVLVAGDVDREGAGLRRHRGADPLGVHALSELDERGRVEADVGDVARGRLLEDGRGRGAESHPLGLTEEGVELRLEVEAVLRVDEMVDEAHRELARRDADGLVGVAVDDVVVAGSALDRAGLAAAGVVAGQGLQLERDVLGDVTEPRALVEALDEAATTPERARVTLEPGNELDELVREAWQRDGGVVLEAPEVDDEVDGRLVGPDVRSAVDPGLEDLQVRTSRSCGGGYLDGHGNPPTGVVRDVR